MMLSPLYMFCSIEVEMNMNELHNEIVVACFIKVAK